MLNSKAQTLSWLKPTLKNATILDVFYFTVGEWTRNFSECLEKISNVFAPETIFIVRSSSHQEDQLNASSAGKFESILNVRFKDLVSGIQSVIASYGEDVKDKDEVLIQIMLSHVKMSGVLFSKDPKYSAPYYIINYDTSGTTTGITGGCSAQSDLKTLVISRTALPPFPDKRIEKLLRLAQELEDYCHSSSLDIEFAFDHTETLYLLQVRPLILKEPVFLIDQTQVLKKIQNKIEILNRKHPYLYGDRTIFAIMPDWNPAEIIGVRPNPLALSLYKELITDSTWAYQRDNYGYRNLRSFPLLIDFMGLPYIDVRVSFNSFIPKDLEPNIADRLVNYYLDRLESQPFLHDKVEFEIVFSCYTFDLHERIKPLNDFHFSHSDIDLIQQSLRELTNNIIHRDRGLWLKDIEKIQELKRRHELIFSNSHFDYLTKIYWLVQDCKRYGTLPFAGLARAGFIAVQLLNSMVTTGVLTEEEKFLFLKSLNSVSTRMTEDMKALDKEIFLQKYGHLRPGTYDISSARYDEKPNFYFNWEKTKESHSYEKDEFKLSLRQLKKVEQLLKEHRLEHDVVGFFDFIKSAIEGREYSKFIFTKTLSDILFLLKQLAKENDFSEKEMSFMDIKRFLHFYSSTWDLKEEISNLLEEGKKKYNLSTQINLPPLISNTQDIEYFYYPEQKPNFVTKEVITAPVITDLSEPQNLKGKIVFIPSADPGFDWIFTHGISGFVTAYGGANSHMAIRAGELGLPAVIGAGEKLYTLWKNVNLLHVDCANHQVEMLY